MDATRALWWAVYYRILALASAILGGAIALIGFVIGASGLLGQLIDAILEGGDPIAVLTGTSALIMVGSVVVGIAVWQIGKTAAFYKTLTEATEEQMAERYDPTVVKSEILSVLDGRLAEIHAEAETTREALGADPPTVAGEPSPEVADAIGRDSTDASEPAEPADSEPPGTTPDRE